MTKERLRGYRTLLQEKKTLEQQIETVEATLLHPKIQKIKHTPAEPSGGNALEDLAAEHLELIDLYHTKLAEIAQELQAIETCIGALPPTERVLLRLRYVHGLSWGEVCVDMSYSWRQVHRIHAKALETLKEPGEG